MFVCGGFGMLQQICVALCVMLFVLCLLLLLCVSFCSHHAVLCELFLLVVSVL